jgi:hypothetical protein
VDRRARRLAALQAGDAHDDDGRQRRRPEWQSYLGNLAMVKGGGLEKYWTESEVYRCKGGNQQLATRLATRSARRA